MTKKKIYCALDLEGTGLDPRKDAVIEVGAVLFEFTKDDELVFHESFSQLVKPPIPVPPFIQELTGITEQDLADQPSWEQVRPQFEKFVGMHQIVGQNVGFDLAFLAAGGLTFPQGFIDTRELARVFLPDAKFSNLEYLMQYLNRPLTSHHRGLDDAKSAAVLLQEIVRSFHRLDFELQKKAYDLLAGSTLLYRDLFRPTKPLTTAVNRAASSFGQQELFVPQPGENRNDLVADSSSLRPLFKERGVFFADLPISRMHRDTLRGLMQESSAYSDSMVLSVADSVELSGLMPQARQQSWQILRSSEEYICDVRLKPLLSNNTSYPNGLVQFLMRLLLWQHARPTGTPLDELSLSGEEFLFRDFISASYAHCPGHVCAFSQALRAIGVRSKVLTTHAAWLQYIAYSDRAQFPRVLFWNIQALGEIAARNSTRVVSLPRLRRLLSVANAIEEVSGLSLESPQAEGAGILDALDLYFGVMAIAARRAEAEGISNALVDVGLRQQKFFEQMRQATHHFIIRLGEVIERMRRSASARPEFPVVLAKLEEMIKFLKEFFFQPDEQKNYAMEYYAEQLKLTSSTRRTCLYGAVVPPACGLIGLAYPSVVKAYWRRRLELDVVSTLSLAGPRPPLTMLLPETRSVNLAVFDHEAIGKLLTRSLPEAEGRSLIVCNSQKYLEQLYESIHDQAVRSRLIAQRLHGPPWKNLEQYLAGPRAVWLVTASQFLKIRQTISLTNQVIIARLPFESGGTFEQELPGQNTFTEVIMPRTVIRFMDLLSKVIPPEGGTLVFLDARIHAPYMQVLFEAIGMHFEIRRAPLSHNEAGW